MKIIIYFIRFLINVFFKLEIKNKEVLYEKGAVLYCPNHISNWDPIILGSLENKKIRYMAKKELFKFFLIRKIITFLGAFPVDRKEGGKEAIEKSIEILNNGEKLLIFPHGGRIKHNNKKEIKNGFFYIAKEAGVPIVPIKIKSEYKFRSKIEIEFFEKIIISEKDSLEDIKIKLKKIID